MTLPPGIPDPGTDFRCRRCGRWTFSAVTKCECPEGPQRPTALHPETEKRNARRRLHSAAVSVQEAIRNGNGPFELDLTDRPTLYAVGIFPAYSAKAGQPRHQWLADWPTPAEARQACDYFATHLRDFTYTTVVVPVPDDELAF